MKKFILLLFIISFLIKKFLISVNLTNKKDKKIGKLNK